MTAPAIDFPPYEPHPLLARPAVMTWIGTLPRRGIGALVAREESFEVRVDASTKVRVALDRPVGSTPRSAIVILHGLVGSSASIYVLGTAQKALERGFLVARLNARNCGGTEALTREVYNGGQTEELDAVARELVEREGVERVHLVGFSIGGNQVLRLAVGYGDAPPPWLASIGALSPCIDFAASVATFQLGLFQRAVQRRFVQGLKAIVERRHALDPSSISLAGIDGIRTVRAFDERFTAPLSGYANAADYYAQAGVRTNLAPIRVPTLVLTARDDPLVPVETFEALAIGPAPIQVVITERGGHVAFVGKRPARTTTWSDADRRWAENRAVQFAFAHDARASPGSS